MLSLPSIDRARPFARVLSVLLGGSLLGSTAFAQPFEALGVRALGMGGAFVAVADDATAVYWNPAGLATGGFFSAIVEQEGHESITDNTDLEGLTGSSTIVAVGTPPLGLSYYRVLMTEVRPSGDSIEGPQDGRNDLGGPAAWVSMLETHHTGASLVQTVVDGLTVGATLRYVRGTARGEVRTGPQPARVLLDQAEELTGQSTGRADLDLGLMYAVSRVRLGVTLRNLREPTFNLPGGGRLTLDRRARVGLAVMPTDRLTVAIDADLTRTQTPLTDRRIMAGGAEWWIVATRLAARGGIRASTLGEARPVGAGGVSVGIRSGWTVDGQFSLGRHDERGWGLAGRLVF